MQLKYIYIYTKNKTQFPSFFKFFFFHPWELERWQERVSKQTQTEAYSSLKYLNDSSLPSLQRVPPLCCPSVCTVCLNSSCLPKYSSMKRWIFNGCSLLAICWQNDECLENTQHMCGQQRSGLSCTWGLGVGRVFLQLHFTKHPKQTYYFNLQLCRLKYSVHVNEQPWLKQWKQRQTEVEREKDTLRGSVEMINKDKDTQLLRHRIATEAIWD